MKLEQATAWSLLPILTLSVLSVATVPIYYQALGSEDYALWFAIQTMAGTFGFMDLGLGVATGRFVGIALGRGDFVGAREIWATGNLLNFLILLMMAAAFAGLGSWWGTRWFSFVSMQGPLFYQCVWWSALGLFLNYYGQGWQILLQAHLEFRWLSLNRTLFSLLTGVGMAWSAWAFHSPLPCIIWGTAMAGLQLLVLMIRANAKYQMGFLFSSARMTHLKEMGVFTGKIFLSLLSSATLGSLDRWLLGRAIPPDSFVAYNVGSNLAGRVQGLSVAAMGPIFHGSSRSVGQANPDELSQIYCRSVQLLAPLYFAGALWVTIWQLPWLQLWLGTEAGATLASFLPFLFWAASWSALMNISGAQLGPLNLVGFGTLVQSISWLASGLFAWLGWRYAGLPGAGVGLMAGRILLMAQDLHVRRRLRVSLRASWPMGKMVFVMLGVALFWIGSKVFPNSTGVVIILSILNLLVLFGLLFFPHHFLGQRRIAG